MNTRGRIGIDEVLMPGQVASLQRRLELLEPERDRCVKAIAAATAEAKALADGGKDVQGSDRATKRAARLKVELASVQREMDTLKSLVVARIGNS